MDTHHQGYERLIERIISTARRRYAQIERAHLPIDGERLMTQALCDDNLTFTASLAGMLVVEGAVLVAVNRSVEELRAAMAAAGLTAGVWLEMGETLNVERVLLALDGQTPLIFPDASVLVAVMTHPRDFEIARDEGWYRIPRRSAPRFFPPDYIAFYFTRAFGAAAFSVRYFAAVRGHELLSRRELLPAEADHPRADEPYYKLQLGRLTPRQPPIVSKTWRRITFILTNGRRFSTAGEINELILGPQEHDLLWRALKEAGLHAERNYVIRDERAVYRVDMAVRCRQGMVGIMCSDCPPARRAHQPTFPLLQFDPEQVETGLADCLQAVQAAVTQLGGAADVG